jgi:asparagine synthase (glutamine-hydrolysing)
MCGVCGALYAGTHGADQILRESVGRMSDSMRHRGPDDGDAWVDADAGVTLGHRRLSILDLSPTGHQPMRSANGRYVVVLNGEIYNFRELRTELQACGGTFRGTSDTEILLAAVERWGVAGAAKKSVGMFAFAIWDRQDRRLHLGRDRIGEKPLYYGWQGSTFLFGSELKSLRAHPDWRGEIDRNALSLFFRFGYIPAPASIYFGIRKLPAGTTLSIGSSAPGEVPEPKAYWSAAAAVERGRNAQFTSEADALAELEPALRLAVRQQMVADVPIGAFLSGGIDSSLIVALMQAQSSTAVKTFTIGFLEDQYSEAEAARAVAKHLGTDHTELLVTPDDAMSIIPSLPTLYDEPYADSSQIPTHIVSRLARREVTVALSGDGGDELFGGYNRYLVAPAIWKRVSWMPYGARRPFARMLRRIPPAGWDTAIRLLRPVMSRNTSGLRLGEKMRKLNDVLGSHDADSVYDALVTIWPEADSLVGISAGSGKPDVNAEAASTIPSFEDRMMYLDLMSYLPDDILTKVDRAAMGVSLETRVPFLDHRVVELAWRIPLAVKIHSGAGKQILRSLLYRHVPRELIERPKMGFGVPVGQWIRGPLRPWAEELLSEKRLSAGGFVDAAPIRRLWAEHLSGRVDAHSALWAVLMFESWRASISS